MPQSAIGSTITRDDAVSDVDLLFHTLEDVHPDLYGIRPRDSVAAQRTRLIAALPPTLSRPELWTRLAPVVAALGDGHTNIPMPREEVRRMQSAGAPVFPPSVALDDAGRLVISAALVRRPVLEGGDRLVSLNGLSADSLLHAWMNETSGENERFRAAEVTSGFRDFLLIHSVRAPYTLVSKRSDGTFSSAMELADAIKTYHLATLIGEETGGRPNGFGEAYVFRLPRSQLAVSVSSALFVRASGDTTDHRGVVPDIVIALSDSDRRAGRDPVLERAKDC